MLDFLRNSSQSWLMKMILGAVVLVFVFFGVGSYNSQTLNVIAEINGEMVLLSEYQQVFDNALEQARLEYKGNLTDEITDNIRKQSLNTLFGQKLIIQNSHSNGFEITDLELATWLYKSPVFQTDGRFDRRKYVRMLKNQRMTEGEYERNTREQLLLEKFIRFVTGGIVISEQQAKNEYEKAQKRVSLKLLEITPDQFAKEVTVSDDQIKQFYDLNPNLFKTAKKFKVNALLFNKEDVQAKLKVREKEISKYYQKNLDSEFTTKPSANVRHILISVPADADTKSLSAKQEKAQKLYAQLLKNKDKFASLAKIQSDDPGSKMQGGNLGWQQEGVYTNTFEQVIKSLPIGQVSAPFRTEFGFHIAEVLERKEGQVQTLEESKSKIETAILQKKGTRRLKNLAAKLEKSLNQKTLESIATEYNKELLSPKAFSQRTMLKELGSTSELFKKLNAAGSAKTGIVRQGDDQFLVYQLTETIEPELIAFDDMKDKASGFARSEALKNLTAQKFTELRDQVKTSEQFNETVQVFNAKTKDITIKFSDIFHPELGYIQELKNAVFSMKTTDKITSIHLSGKNYLVLKSGELAPEKQLTDQQIQNLRAQLGQRKAQFILNRIVQKMREEAQIEYNAQLMKALKITA